MLHIEELTSYNYAISYRGCGKRRWYFGDHDVEENLYHDLNNLLQDHINHFKCKVELEDLQDVQHGDVTMLDIHIYVVFNMSSEPHLMECLDTIGDYLDKSYVENIID